MLLHPFLSWQPGLYLVKSYEFAYYGIDSETSRGVNLQF